MWNESLLVLPLLPLLVRLLSAGARDTEEEPWHWLIDPPLLLGCGLYSALACGWWFADFHLKSVVTSSDFHEYCSSVAAWSHQQVEAYYSRNRSVLLGILPGEFAKDWGIHDGLALSSVVSCGLVGSAVYLWARAVWNRLAGLSAAVLVAAVGALAILPRTLSFYPELAAFFTLSGAGVAVAWRWPRSFGLLFGSTMVGLVLLADLRGLAFGLSHGGLLLLAALWGAWKAGDSWKKRLAYGLFYLLCVGGPFWGSWYLGRYAYLPETPPLEARMDVRQFFWERGYKDHHFVPPYGYPSRYIWGRTSLQKIPKTLSWMVEQRRIVPADWRTKQRTAPEIDQHVTPWFWPGILSLGISVLGLYRHPTRAVALLGTLVPYAALLNATISMVDFHERFLSSGLSFLPVLLGGGWSVLCLQPIPWPRLPFSTPPLWRQFLAILLLCLLVFGAIPTWLSPAADWRIRFNGDRQARKMLDEASSWQGASEQRYCYDNLRTDLLNHPRAGYQFFPP